MLADIGMEIDGAPYTYCVRSVTVRRPLIGGTDRVGWMAICITTTVDSVGDARDTPERASEDMRLRALQDAARALHARKRVEIGGGITPADVHEYDDSIPAEAT